MRKYNWLITFTLIVILALLVMELPIRAETTYATPDDYLITLYKTELSSNNGSSWVTVFTDVGGEEIDLKTNAGSAFGQGSIPPGTYNVIRFTIKNTISASSTLFNPYPITPTAQVEVYFAVSGTFEWDNNGSSLAEAFPLPDPIQVVANATSKVIMNFGVNNSLVIPGAGDPYLNPPIISVSNIVINPAAPTEFEGGEYYFVRQNTSLPVTITNASTVTPTRMRLSSGWGVISMSPPVEGMGIFTIDAVDNAEHYWRIQSDYVTGTLATVGTAIEGKYYVDADGFINMLMPASGGIIRGAVRGDGKVFAAIELATPTSDSADTSIGYHMIYAIAKEITGTGDWTLLGDGLFNVYAIYIQDAVVTSTGLSYPSRNMLSFNLNVGYLDLGPDSLSISNTRNGLYVTCPLSATGQSVNFDNTCYEADIESLCITVTQACTWTMNDMTGAILNDGTFGILAGSTSLLGKHGVGTEEIDNGTGITTTGRDLNFGIFIKPRPANYWRVDHPSDLVGAYSFVCKGDIKDDGTNELPSNIVMLGRLNLNADGTFTGRNTQSQRGELEIEIMEGSWAITTTWIGATPTAGSALQTDVVILYDTNPAEPFIILLIGYDGTVLVPYSPMGTLAVPLNDKRMLGLAVKQ
ncbi:hypothetical protein ACFL5I_01430 [Planctomycetota bacterium]